jgi:hypothetical protein
MNCSAPVQVFSPTQDGFKRLHHEHLYADKLDKYVQFHVAAVVGNGAAQQQIAHPFACRFPLCFRCRNKPFSSEGVGFVPILLDPASRPFSPKAWIMSVDSDFCMVPPIAGS